MLMLSALYDYFSFFLLLPKTIDFYVCECLPACMSVSKEAEEGIRSSGTRVIDSCEPTYVCWE